MNSNQIIQVMIGFIISALIIRYRNYLRDKKNFTEAWRLITALALGISMGILVDAIIIPDRLTMFVFLTFFLTAAYTRQSIVIPEKE